MKDQRKGAIMHIDESSSQQIYGSVLITVAVICSNMIQYVASTVHGSSYFFCDKVISHLSDSEDSDSLL